MSSSASSTVAVTASPLPPPSGRLAVMTAYAVAASAIPVPFVPDRIITSIRGAVAHDAATRHGLSLTSDARALLANAYSEHRARMVQATESLLRQLVRRRLRPLGTFDSAVRGVEVYALGLLLERYFARARAEGSLRVQLDEARRVRDAVDRAFLRAFSPTLHPNPTLLPEGVDDLRDEFTRWIDTFLLTSAALPSYIERRLEAAFDEMMRQYG